MVEEDQSLLPVSEIFVSSIQCRQRKQNREEAMLVDRLVSNRYYNPNSKNVGTLRQKQNTVISKQTAFADSSL